MKMLPAAFLMMLALMFAGCTMAPQALGLLQVGATATSAYQTTQTNREDAKAAAAAAQASSATTAKCSRKVNAFIFHDAPPDMAHIAKSAPPEEIFKDELARTGCVELAAYGAVDRQYALSHQIKWDKVSAAKVEAQNIAGIFGGFNTRMARGDFNGLTVTVILRDGPAGKEIARGVGSAKRVANQGDEAVIRAAYQAAITSLVTKVNGKLAATR